MIVNKSNAGSQQETLIVFELVYIWLLRRTPRQRSSNLQDLQTEKYLWRQHRQPGAAAHRHAVQVRVVHGHLVALADFCIYRAWFGSITTHLYCLQVF